MALLADLEKWKEECDQAYDSAWKFYRWSPEHDNFWDSMWRQFDVLEAEARGRLDPDDEPDWIPAMKDYRRWQQASREENFAPPNPKYHQYRPLWVHLDHWTNSGSPMRTLYPLRAAKANWDKFVRIFQENESFRTSLSPTQRSSYQILHEWMLCNYSMPELLEKMLVFMRNTQDNLEWGGSTLASLMKEAFEEGMADCSLYHFNLIELFIHEFHPYSWEPFEGRKSLIVLQQRRYFASRRAAMQRISWAARVFYQAPGPRERSSEAVRPFYARTSVHKEPWFMSSGDDPREHPYFLWDVINQKTVAVQDLPTCPAYTCVSHTWGRWRISAAAAVQDPKSSCWLATFPPGTSLSVQEDASGRWAADHSAYLDGVPWLVPQVTLYDVHELPSMLQLLGCDYVWFDLFCIPQDGSQLAQIEISRQSTIFRRAQKCVAWLHDVESWEGVSRALDWMGLKYLAASSKGDLFGISEEILRHAAELADSHIGLVANTESEREKNVGSWFSSLWTLQEAAMRPDMHLYSRHWQRLEDRQSVPITLEALVIITDRGTSFDIIQHPKPETPFSQHLEYLIEVTKPSRSPAPMPRGPLSLSTFGRYSNSNGLSVCIEMRDPAALFACSTGRACTSSRAPGIMSALEVTDWYKKRVTRNGGREGEDNTLVLGVFPIDFIREAFSKYGVRFLQGMSARVSWLSLHDIAANGTSVPRPQARGSALPFSSLQQHEYAYSAGQVGSRHFTPSADILLDPTPHAAVWWWDFLRDGSMVMPKAGILGSSVPTTGKESEEKQSLGSQVVSCGLRWSRMVLSDGDGDGNDTESFIIDKHEPIVPDLFSYLREYTPVGHVIFAVALFEHDRTQTGMLLQTPEVPQHSRNGETTYLVKVGDYHTDSHVPLPPCEDVKWVVL